MAKNVNITFYNTLAFVSKEWIKDFPHLGSFLKFVKKATVFTIRRGMKARERDIVGIGGMGRGYHLPQPIRESKED